MREKEFLPLINSRLGIQELNPMQKEMMQSASLNKDTILLAPTGSGKTLAFILPMLKLLKPSTGRVQVVIIAPSRELSIQIYNIIREIASGFKTSVLYGGHKVEDEVNSLKITPDIIVATPGRLLDHINRRNIDLLPSRILILDEFDKSLEFGFEEEMKKIIRHLKNISRTILTSATNIISLPDFISLNQPITHNYLQQNTKLRSRLRIHRVDADGKDKLNSLASLLFSLAHDGQIKRTIIFVNHRESAVRVADFLNKINIDATIYHGALEQMDREKAIIMFNNGSRNILVATDLAARGLDIDNVKHIIHYHQPMNNETYLHRNGRTARVNAEGDIYVIVSPEENIAEFISFDDSFYCSASPSININLKSNLTTLYISAGKKEKISRGDVVGFLINQGNLTAEEIGKIDIRDHYSLVAIPANKATKVCQILINAKIKGTRRKIVIAK